MKPKILNPLELDNYDISIREMERILNRYPKITITKIGGIYSITTEARGEEPPRWANAPKWILCVEAFLKAHMPKS